MSITLYKQREPLNYILSRMIIHKLSDGFAINFYEGEKLITRTVVESDLDPGDSITVIFQQPDEQKETVEENTQHPDEQVETAP